MSEIAHFFDLDCLLQLDQQAWVVDKTNPSTPLLKISKSELKLAKSGVFKSKGNKIEFNGITYFLSDELWNRIKIFCIKNNVNVSNLVISLQEFLNPEIIENMKIEIKKDIILNLKNNISDLYLVCSRYFEKTYKKIIQKLIDELEYDGITVKNFYFLDEDFINDDIDETQYKKIKLILQHSLGYKSQDNKFIDQEIQKYKTLHWYDKSSQILNLCNISNDVLNSMLRKTDKGLSDVIRDDLRDDTPVLYVHKIQDNELNPIITKKTKLSLPNIVRKFESFKLFL
jgi:hypothetical protein